MLPLLLQVPKPYVGGVCALVQEGRAGQLVPEIRPRHSGTGPPFRDRAVFEGTCASPLETAVLRPRKKNALYPSEHSDTPDLVPTSPEGCVIRCLSYNSRFPAATGLFIPWYGRELMLVPGAGAWSCTVSSTLA